MSKYGTIFADPPWIERGGGKSKRGADRHYPLMPTKSIMTLPVQDFTADNSHLWLWVTNNFLIDGLKVMEAWGFRYITMLTWGKVKETESGLLIQQGLGQYMRGSTEHVLFGAKGRVPYKVIGGKRQQCSTLLLAPRTKHSVKPQEAYDHAMRISPGPYLEMFARNQRPGWDAWGNEVSNDIEL